MRSKRLGERIICNFLSLRLPFGQPPPSSEGGMGAVRTRRSVMGAEETVRFRAANGRPYRVRRIVWAAEETVRFRAATGRPYREWGTRPYEGGGCAPAGDGGENAAGDSQRPTYVIETER